MKTTRRLLAALLTVVMILPIICTAVIAEETGIIWAGESFNSGSLSNVTSQPASAQIVSKNDLNPTDKALKIDIKGVATASRTAPYYAWLGNNAYEITDYSYDPATNTVTGKFSVNGTAYDISGTVDTGELATCSAGSYRIYTPDMVDAVMGWNNVAKALTVKSPKISASSNKKVVFQYKLWFENGSKGTLASRVYTTAGVYVEFFGLNANGNNTVTLQQHENAKIVLGSSKTLQTEKWYTVSVAVDLTDSYRDIYLDGEYAFTTLSLAGAYFDLPAEYDLRASSWDIIQINRNNYKPSDLAGSLMIDDLCIYDESILEGFTVPSIDQTVDFESYTDKITAGDGFNAQNAREMVAYNKILSETLNGENNKFVRVPLMYDGTGSNAIGTAGYTNWDKTLALNNATVSRVNGTFAVLDIDYRPHAKDASCDGTVEVQLRDVLFDMEVANGAKYRATSASAWTDATTDARRMSGFYLKLFDINLKSGELTGNLVSDMKKTGVEGLRVNEWNHIRYMVNLEDTSYYLYVNGYLYGIGESMQMTYSDGSWCYAINASNLVIPEGKLLVAKVNKKDNSFVKAEEADATWSNTNYIDIDNVQLSATNETPEIVMPPINVKNDFEGYTLGMTLTRNDSGISSSASTIAPYNKVLSETVNGAENQYLRVPFLYNGEDGKGASASTPSNYDKTIHMDHVSFDKTNGRYMIYEADYRRSDSDVDCTVQLQLHNYYVENIDTGNTVSGQYMSLCTINLKTGVIQGHDGYMTATGADGLRPNEWTNVRFVLDLANPSYRIYVNDVLYGYYDSMKCMYYEGGWKTVDNARNIELQPGNLIIAKMNKQTAAYTKLADAASDYSNTNYIDIDNMKLITTNELPPIILPPVKAEDTFEDYSVGMKITSANGYSASGIVAYNKVLADTDGNKFVRVPIVYDGTGSNGINTSGYTNYDKTLIPNHSVINAERGKYVVFTMDYRPHTEDAYAANTVEIQLNNFKFDALVANGAMKKARNASSYNALTEDEYAVSGMFFKLFDINLGTGELSGNTSTSLEKTGAPGLTQDEWNRVQMVFNLEDLSYCIYVNGLLYGISEGKNVFTTKTDWYAYSNASNVSINQNSFIVSKINKVNDSFAKVAEADEFYSNVNYIDMDNLSLTSATDNDVTVLSPENEEGLALMYVAIGGEKVENRVLYLTKDIEYTAEYFDPAAINYSGLLETETKSSVRISVPTGLRFATKILDTEALDEIFALAGKDYKSVEIGTLVVPVTYIADIDFTVDALKAAGRSYLTIAASHGHYFQFDNDDSTTHFVGSIVNLREASIARDFAATGYIKITLWGGREFYFYSSNHHVGNVKHVATAALNDQTMNWSGLHRSIIETYASGRTLDEMIANDMQGMSVLAFGDSLFGGTIGYDQATQWVNKLGVDNGWNLTNLGIGSMTVSMTDRNNVKEYGDKNSMYDWMFNGKNDFHWGSTSTHTSPNPFFHTGNPNRERPEDVELIILEGGCNDYGTAISAPLGTPDSRDPGTFLGAWNLITEQLLKEYPNATIVFVTTWRLPPQTRTDDTLTSVEFSESVITLYNEVYASNDRIALINAGDPKVSGVDMLDNAWRTEYSTDYYHLKDTGMAVMADHMLPLLWEIVMKARDAK